MAGENNFQIGFEIDNSGLNRGLQQAIQSLTASIGTINDSFGKFSNTISSNLESSSKATEKLSSSVDNMSKNVSSSMNTASGSVGTHSNKMKSDLQGFPSVTGSVSSAFSSMASTIATTVAGFVGIGAAFSAVKKGLNFDNDIQQASISFETMLGSAEKAKKMIEELKTFAAETPFEFPDLQTASKRMLAFGFESESILPTLKAVGDAASGLGMKGNEGINRIVLALGQMRAKSKVSGDEMLQLTEAGIPAWDILAQSMGKTTAEVMKLSEKGVIPADKAIQALVYGMETRFPNMMQKQSQTFQGLMSTIKDNSQFIIGDIVQPLFDKLATDVLPKVVDGLNDFKDAMKVGGIAAGFKTVFNPAIVDGFLTAVRGTVSAVRLAASAVDTLSPVLAGLAIAYGTVKLAAIGSSIAMGVQAIAVAVQTGAVGLATTGTWAFSFANIAATASAIATTLATEGLSAAFVALAAAMNLNPVILAISLSIAALGVIVYEVITHWTEFKEFCIGLWNYLVNLIADNIGKIILLFPGLAAIIYIVSESWEPVINFLKGLWEWLCSAIQKIVEVIGRIMSDAGRAISGFVDGAQVALGRFVDTLMQIVVSILPSWANDFLRILTDLGNKAAAKSAEIGNAIRKNLTIQGGGDNSTGGLAGLNKDSDTNEIDYTTSVGGAPTVGAGGDGVDWSDLPDAGGKEKKAPKGAKEETPYEIAHRAYQEDVSDNNYNDAEKLQKFHEYLDEVEKTDKEVTKFKTEQAKLQYAADMEYVDTTAAKREYLAKSQVKFSEQAAKDEMDLAQKKTEFIKARFGEESKEYYKAKKEELEAAKTIAEKIAAASKVTLKDTQTKNDFTIADDEENLRHDKAMGKYDYDDKGALKAEQDLEMKKETLALDSLQSQKANLQTLYESYKDTYKDIADAIKLQMDNVEKEIAKSQEKIKQSSKKNDNQLAELMAKPFKDLKSNIQGSMATCISSILKGTATIKSAFSTLASSILNSMIDMWAQQIAASAMASATAGATATATAQSTTSGIMGMLTNVGKALSKMPWYGWVGLAILAAVANGQSENESTSDVQDRGASTYYQSGAVTGLPSYDVGSWSLPSDTVAQVHKGEMIVPAKGGFADSVRGMISGGKQGGGNVTNSISHSPVYNVSAMDAKGVGRVLRNNSREVTQSLYRVQRTMSKQNATKWGLK